MEELLKALSLYPNLNDILETMKKLGSSVSLTWDEETRVWECSWITSGRRLTARHEAALGACRAAILKVVQLSPAIEPINDIRNSLEPEQLEAYYKAHPEQL